MINIQCKNKFVSSFFIEINENLYEKKPEEGHLYINGVRAKALPNGVTYQMIEPELIRYFDEICQKFNNAEIDVDEKTFLPLSVKRDNEYILRIEFDANSIKIISKIGLNEVRHIRNIIENVFRNKIIPLLKEVSLYND
jgi:hypothetical protein